MGDRFKTESVIGMGQNMHLLGKFELLNKTRLGYILSKMVHCDCLLFPQSDMSIV